MALPYRNIKQALDAQLQDFSDDYANEMTVAWPGIIFNVPDPNDRVPWLRPTLLLEGARRSSIGPSGLIRLHGTYQVDLFWPTIAGDGTGDPLDRGAALVSKFKAGTSLLNGSVTVSILESYLLTGRDDPGGWWHLPARMDWECYATNS